MGMQEYPRKRRSAHPASSAGRSDSQCCRLDGASWFAFLARSKAMNAVTQPTVSWAPIQKSQDEAAIEPFRVDVPDEGLTDLQARLSLTRWAHDFANERWQYGTNTAYLKELVTYWIDGYDWRKHERAIN